MSTILFPTDFSATAESTLNFALSFAQKTKSRIILFNTYPVPVYVNNDMPIEMKVNEEIKTEAELNLKKLEERIRSSHPGLETECISAWGFATDEILAQAKEKKVDYIVMGTHGADGLRKLLLGTNTAEVVNKAECAVIAIPENYSFVDLKEIAFATNCNDEEIPAIKRTIELAKLLDAKVFLLHVADGILNTKIESSTLDGFKMKVVEATGFNKIETEMIETPDLIKGLSEYVNAKGIDLLAVSHHKRSYLLEWLHPSVSKEITYKLPSPLLAIPV